MAVSARMAADMRLLCTFTLLSLVLTPCTSQHRHTAAVRTAAGEREHILALYTPAFTSSGLYASHPFTVVISRLQPAERAAETVCLRLESRPSARIACIDSVLAEWRRHFQSLLPSGSPPSSLLAHGRLLQRSAYHAESVQLLRHLLLLLPSGSTEALTARRGVAYSLLYSGQYEAAMAEFRLAFDAHSRLSFSVTALPPQHPYEKVLPFPSVSLHRLQHDWEQLSCLTQRGLIDSAVGAAAVDLYRSIYESVHGDELYAAAAATAASEPPIVQLTDRQWAQLSPLYNRRLYLADGSRLEHEPVLRPGIDWSRLQSQYLNSAPRLVVVDDALSPAALARLRDYLQLSTVWNVDRVFGYIGSYADWGLEFPLLAQLASALHDALPAALCSLKLTRAWAYKLDSRLPIGLNVHADAGTVTVSFWLTGDAANLNDSTGGLTVFAASAPPADDFSTNAGNTPRAQQLIAQSGNESTRIPYRSNRMLLFSSDLLHQTDQMHFRQGYEHRRISLTLLFGSIGERCRY